MARIGGSGESQTNRDAGFEVLKEAALDIAIKQLALNAKDSDGCNSLDELYEGIREYVLDKAKKELKKK